MTATFTPTRSPLGRAACWLTWGGFGLAVFMFIAWFVSLGLYQPDFALVISLIPLAGFIGITLYNLGLILGLVAIYRGQAKTALHWALWLPIALVALLCLIFWAGALLLQGPVPHP
ncbi:hypothetical protein [Rothia nasimurium]|uniref:hypothetical protein n=1 Tax=Rothia nasimurium TaxID=85336 RepID=UPI001F222E42|nr:hypothetical protein [Rothia nasimurium]